MAGVYPNGTLDCSIANDEIKAQLPRVDAVAITVVGICQRFVPALLWIFDLTIGLNTP